MSISPPVTGGPEETPAVHPTHWSAATQRVRDTASWIVKAFVALAAVLVGSGPLLANLQNLHANSRGFLAIGAAALGLIAIGTVTWLAANVNLTQITDIGDLLAPTDPDTRKLMQRISSGVPREVYLGGRNVGELLETDGRMYRHSHRRRRHFRASLPSMSPRCNS